LRRELTSRTDSQQISHITYSPDGKHIAAGSIGGEVHVWTSAGKPINRFRHFENNGASIRHLSFLDNTHVFSVEGVSSMGVKWDIHNNRTSCYLLGARIALFGATLDRSTRLCASCSPAAIHIETGKDWTKKATEIKLPIDHPIRELALSDDGRRLLGVSKKGKLYLFDVDNSKLINEWQGHERTIYGLVTLPELQGFVTSGAEGDIKLWDSAGKLIVSVECRYRHAVTALAVSPDHTLLATAGEQQRIVLWDIKALLKGKR
jgi:WD40 repeat protein